MTHLELLLAFIARASNATLYDVAEVAAAFSCGEAWKHGFRFGFFYGNGTDREDWLEDMGSKNRVESYFKGEACGITARKAFNSKFG